MSRWSYGRDGEPRGPGPGTERRQPSSGVPGDRGSGDGRPGQERTAPEPPRHRGRRDDDRGRPRRSREQRVQELLELLGTYRVVSRRSVVGHCFDGHPFAAARTLPVLVEKGLIAIHMLRAGGRGYQVLSLTGAGRDRAGFGARRRRRERGGEDDAESQRYWTGLADLRQLRHDHHVFEAVMRDTEDVRRRGGRIRRVRLETELRGVLASAGETARGSDGVEGAERARREAAMRIGLRTFAEGVPLPDALVEIEDVDGARSVRAVEVVTGSYTHTQVRQKRLAGFRLYALPGCRTERKRRAGWMKDVEELFPLSWGSSR